MLIDNKMSRNEKTAQWNSSSNVRDPRLLPKQIKSESGVKNVINQKRTTGFTQKPSSLVNKHKQADPWGSKQQKFETNFSYVYSQGGIPCRINHGSIKNTITWDQPPQSLDYNPLLITCCEGLCETQHPFVYLARQSFTELMTAEDADQKVRQIFPQLINPLRNALISKSDDIFCEGLKALQLISNAVKTKLNEHLTKFLSQIHRKLAVKKFNSIVTETLSVLEQNGGTEAYKIIKSKIPTYGSC